MGKSIVVAGLASLALALGVGAGVSAEATGTSAEAGTRPHRIFVTKVYPGRGVLSGADFAQLADAGFTTVVARWKRDVPAYARGAAAAGLNSMAWEGGMADAERLGVPHTVTREGRATRYTVPYSRQAWQFRTQILVGRAELSLTCPTFKGVLLDFEIYDKNKTDGFAESYDEGSFIGFLTAQELPVPDPIPPPDQRRRYLSGLGMHKQYVARQYDLVAREVAQLRQAVDAVNPRFQLGVYGWGPLIEAVRENVATSEAPVLIVNAATYGRATYGKGGYDTTRPDRPALKWSLITNAQMARQAPQLSYPAVFLGGHNPREPGSGDAYTFTVRQAFNSIAYGPGYWIWTDWGIPSGWDSRQEWIDALMACFKSAHAALDAGDFAWASRQTVQIADPEATTPLIILTADDAIATVKAWDPLTGRQVNVAERPGGAWTTDARGDDYAIVGNEHITLEDGWIRVSDPDTDVLLLRFHVGDSQTKLQLIKATPQKLRVLVDKVLTKGTREVDDKQAEEIAGAGFNIFAARFASHHDEQKIRNAAAIAQRHGLGYMIWMHGTMAPDQGPRMVWANGVEQEIRSPNSDELWDSFTGRILTFAEVSVDHPALCGVFFDFEIYAPNKQGVAYGLSYDLKILNEFARANDIDIPSLPPGRRSSWLFENGLHDEFSRFQIDSWRRRFRKLRTAIDRLNPRFQFAIYHAESLFTEQALLPELATQDAPAIIADASTYSRPSVLLNHRDALETNHTNTRRLYETTHRSPLPLLFMSGIDPIVPGADPEFCGKNASMIAEATDGYWVFYELRKQQRPDHPEYWEWFSRANHRIKQGDFTLWQEPRETPDSVVEDKITVTGDGLHVATYGAGRAVDDLLQKAARCEVHTLGGLSLDYLKQFKLVMLQNFNVAAGAGSKLCRTLRTYVEQGGALLFTHDTIWYMDSPFPEVATRAIPTHQHAEAGRHVANTDLRIAQAHPAVGDIPAGTAFTSAFRDHMIFEPGPEGATILENTLGDPACVVGKCGRGRVVFTGCYYGYHGVPPEGRERQFFLGLVDWLTVDARGVE